jgi:hypothetical protein
MKSQIKKLVPRSVKAYVKLVLRERQLAQALKEIRTLSAGEIPSQELLNRCQEGWGDDGYRAIGGYFEEVVTAAVSSKGPILELGSGLTTLLLGLLAPKNGISVWSLEHHPQFFARTQAKLARYKIHGINLILAPLSDYGDFSWYSSPELQNMPMDFRLVIADGPPGTGHGGRVGLLPVMRNRFAPEIIILLDDVDRVGELEVLRCWSEQYHVSYEVRAKDGKAWAICRPNW